MDPSLKTSFSEELGRPANIRLLLPKEYGAIDNVTADQRHTGQDHHVLQNRQALKEEARQRRIQINRRRTSQTIQNASRILRGPLYPFLLTSQKTCSFLCIVEPLLVTTTLPINRVRPGGMQKGALKSSLALLFRLEMTLYRRHVAHSPSLSCQAFFAASPPTSPTTSASSLMIFSQKT